MMNSDWVPKRVEKPWGYELHWAKTEKYVGKILHVTAGHALSLQYHNIKDETIYLHTGRMLFEIERNGELTKQEMKPGDSVHVTPKTVHRGRRGALGRRPSTVITASAGKMNRYG